MATAGVSDAVDVSFTHVYVRRVNKGPFFALVVPTSQNVLATQLLRQFECYPAGVWALKGPLGPGFRLRMLYHLP